MHLAPKTSKWAGVVDGPSSHMTKEEFGVAATISLQELVGSLLTFSAAEKVRPPFVLLRRKTSWAPDCTESHVTYTMSFKGVAPETMALVRLAAGEEGHTELTITARGFELLNEYKRVRRFLIGFGLEKPRRADESDYSPTDGIG